MENCESNPDPYSNHELIEISLHFEGRDVRLKVDIDTAHKLWNDADIAKQYVERILAMDLIEGTTHESKEPWEEPEGELVGEGVDEPRDELEEEAEDEASCSAKQNVWCSKRPGRNDHEATKLFLKLREKYSAHFKDKKHIKNQVWAKVAEEMQEKISHHFLPFNIEMSNDIPISRFSSICEGEIIDAFAVIMTYLKDDSLDKWNLVIGGYRDDNGQPWVLPVVREIEFNISRSNDCGVKEYLPALGSTKFRYLAAELVLGPTCTTILENKILSIQTLSGSGALRLGAEFLSKSLKYDTFYCSIPTYRNHKLLFKNAGFGESKEYRYWSERTQTLNIRGLLEDLREAPKNAVIILQVCVHNPTGHDPRRDDWIKIADVVQERQLFPFFDMAFQGLASGNAEEDAWPVRYFVSRGIELMCAQSFSKISGLYNERIGNLLVVLNESDNFEQVESQFVQLVEGMYGSPPSHGASIMEAIMGEMELFRKWKETDINVIRNRIIKIRLALRTSLEELGTPGDWSSITKQIGMTTTSRLTEVQVKHLAQKHHIYILSNGNFNICALNTENVDRFASAIHETILMNIC